MTPNSLWRFSKFRSIFQNLWTKWYFLSFHSCSCDVISPSFAYQDGALHITSFLTLNANILRTTSDIKKSQRRSFLFWQILRLRSTCFLGELSLWDTGTLEHLFGLFKLVVFFFKNLRKSLRSMYILALYEIDQAKTLDLVLQQEQRFFALRMNFIQIYIFTSFTSKEV